MAYLLDANVFIQAKNLHYGLDFCPAFWEWLVEANQRGILYSLEQVDAEIQAGNDDLSLWARARGPAFFLPLDATIIPALGTVSTWATSQQYEQAAISTFLQIADYYLVAYAMAHGHTVVTHEVARDSRRRIRIPNACLGLGVRFMNPFEMLRRESARFVLEAQTGRWLNGPSND